MDYRLKPLLLFFLFAIAGLTGEAKANSTVSITSVSSSGQIASGFQEVTLIFSSDFEGTVQGVAFDGETDASLTLRAQSGQSLGQVRYTVTAGSIRIVRVLP